MRAGGRLALTSGLSAAIAAVACTPPLVVSVADPAAAHRFEILSVGDSTFRFLAAGAQWVRAGDGGVVVDPSRRDALVAQFVVQRRVADTALALVTGQTARVTPVHVALLDPPRLPPVHERTFWLGVAAGAFFATVTALLVR